MTNTPYDQGFQAFLEGLDQESNPYDSGTDDFYDWEGGWVAASDQDAD